MKQLKKLSRRQKDLLKKKGIDASNYLLKQSDTHQFIAVHINGKKEVVMKYE